MARALMGGDFEADDGEAMLTDEELAQGTMRRPGTRGRPRGGGGEERQRCRSEDRGRQAAEAAGGGEDAGAARIAVPGCRRRARHRAPTPCSPAPSPPRLASSTRSTSTPRLRDRRRVSSACHDRNEVAKFLARAGDGLAAPCRGADRGWSRDRERRAGDRDGREG